jgi:hypothetical protein
MSPRHGRGLDTRWASHGRRSPAGKELGPTNNAAPAADRGSYLLFNRPSPPFPSSCSVLSSRFSSSLLPSLLFKKVNRVLWLESLFSSPPLNRSLIQDSTSLSQLSPSSLSFFISSHISPRESLFKGLPQFLSEGFRPSLDRPAFTVSWIP